MVLEVTIVKKRTLHAVTTDGVPCFIVDDDRKPTCRVGDRWTAKAVAGRVKGERGHARVRLIRRISQGLLTEIPGHWIDSRSLEKIQAFLENRVHSLVIGPPGTGKTLLSIRLAAARGWDCFLAECAQIMTPRDLFGADAAVNGSTRFVASAMTSWLEKAASSDEGEVTHLLCLDEINRAQGKAANGLVGLLGPFRKTAVPTIDGTRTIILPRNVGVVATANIGREYSGTYPLDVALEDRFSPINVGHAPVEAMSSLLKAQPRFGVITESDIKTIVMAAQVLRKQYDARRTIQSPPSFRGVEAALVLRTRSWSLRDCIEHGFMGRMDPREKSDLWAALDVHLNLSP